MGQIYKNVQSATWQRRVSVSATLQEEIQLVPARITSISRAAPHGLP